MAASDGHVAIIGAGPAGLTAGYLLCEAGVPVTVLEADSAYVGGISRTVQYKGFYFDIGGHRFFSKSEDVEKAWMDMLGPDMLERPRSSSIHYGGKFYSYPLKAGEALRNLGIVESTLCVLSYLKASVFPVADPKTFEEWVTNQFGKRLFSIFFKTYTEKVWGMPCSSISADWAAQRIKGLSLASAIKNALLPQKQSANRDQVIKTLINSFRYPRKGPGMMWEKYAARIEEMGGTVKMGCKVTGCTFDRSSDSWEIAFTERSAEEQTGEEGTGKQAVVKANHVISSAPIAELVPSLLPQPSEEVVRACESLRYRDFLVVSLILKERNRFSDNWIYIHEPGVKVGRVQNFKSWSPEMVPDPDLCCYGLEYFCFEGDELWNSSDEELIDLGIRELEQLSLAEKGDFVDGCVVRQRKAYPVYDDHYARHVQVIRDEIEDKYPSFHMVGRNGMHKYNNQDHAMMTAMLTAKNIIAGKRQFDVWSVNNDAEYHEEGKTDAGATVTEAS